MARVLIVDDSPVVRAELAAVLVSGGYEIREAANGKEGLAALDGCDLAFCDVNMPEMDGLEFLVRAAPRGIPIVMLTTEGSATVVVRAREAGARGWLVKPFTGQQIISVARKLLQARAA